MCETDSHSGAQESRALSSDISGESADVHDNDNYNYDGNNDKDDGNVIPLASAFWPNIKKFSVRQSSKKTRKCLEFHPKEDFCNCFLP